MANHRKKIDIWSVIMLFSLVLVDVALWSNIVPINFFQLPRIYFFTVTQGESALLVLPHDVTVMIDAGGDANIVSELDTALAGSRNGHYINLAIISYPQLDNYEGYNYILDHYEVGAFIYNGRNDITDTKAWAMFLQKIKTNHIPLITLGEGDTITYGGNSINIISPDNNFARDADLTDTALVEQIRTSSFAALLTSDLSADGANFLLNQSSSLKSDIVKLSNALLGKPSTSEFLNGVAPKIIIISPGVKNTSSAPSKTLINNLISSTRASILRTDEEGTIIIYPNVGRLHIVKEK